MSTMAFQCRICDKRSSTGFAVSHSKRHTKRRWLPNLQKIKVNMAGTVKRMYVCTNCLKSGKVKKAA